MNRRERRKQRKLQSEGGTSTINSSALFLLEQGFQHFQGGQLDQAEDFCDQFIQKEPNNPDGLNLLAAIANERGNINEAIKLMKKAVGNAPENPKFLDNLGQLYRKNGHVEEAIKAYRRALSADPSFADTHNNLGNALIEMSQYEAAIGHYQKALESEANNPRITYNLATTLLKQESIKDAVKKFRQVLQLVPDFTDAHVNLGQCLIKQGNIDDSITHIQRALELDPNHAAAHNNLGVILANRGDWDEAIDQHRRAVDIDPSFVDAWNNLAIALNKTGALEEAMVCYQRSLEIDPDHHASIGNYWHFLMNACAWSEIEALTDQINSLNQRALMRNERVPESPLTTLTRSTDLEVNFQIAKSNSAHISRRIADIGVSYKAGNRRKSKSILTVGYLSYDFRNHVISHLIHRMFKMHDRDIFRVHAYSTGPDDGSHYRREVEQGCDKFVDVQELSHLEAAQRINDDNVDILVDLTGYTEGQRLEIAALRPAPIQISYLGFPGTTGSDFFDYIFLDRVVLSEAEEKFFSEKVFYLPPYYFVVDRPVEDAIKKLSRKEVGLPEDKIVFCCFNKANKIEPVMFGLWMNLLKKVSGSVIWLLADNPLAMDNLKREAVARGVDHKRLVFAERVPKEQHLARHALADIALDTRIYNGGVTTSDALWAGVPVITLRGNHVASRAAASMLTSLGLPELITKDLGEYEAVALKLAKDPEKLRILKVAVVEKAETSPLFDTENSVRNLEKAYRKIWDDFVESKEAR